MTGITFKKAAFAVHHTHKARSAQGPLTTRLTKAQRVRFRTISDQNSRDIATCIASLRWCFDMPAPADASVQFNGGSALSARRLPPEHGSERADCQDQCHSPDCVEVPTHNEASKLYIITRS